MLPFSDRQKPGQQLQWRATIAEATIAVSTVFVCQNEWSISTHSRKGVEGVRKDSGGLRGHIKVTPGPKKLVWCAESAVS